MKGHLILFLALWLFWSMLTGFDGEEVAIGGIVSLAISFIGHYSFSHGKRTSYLKAFAAFSSFVFYYIFSEIVAHIRVIKMIITGKIDPGFVEIENPHHNDWGITMLANAITMTPGTLSVIADKNRMVIHCLDKKISKKDMYAGMDHYMKIIWA